MPRDRRRPRRPRAGRDLTDADREAMLHGCYPLESEFDYVALTNCDPGEYRRRLDRMAALWDRHRDELLAEWRERGKDGEPFAVRMLRYEGLIDG